MFVGLVDVNTPGHIQQLLQPGLVVLLDGAEDGGQHEVVVLGNMTAISPSTINASSLSLGLCTSV